MMMMMMMTMIIRGLFPEEQRMMQGDQRHRRTTILYIDPHKNEKIYLWPGSTTKKLTIWSPKAGYYSVSKRIKYPKKSYRLSKRPWKPRE